MSVHPGRGLGRDGDLRWGGCGACGFGETNTFLPGASGKIRGHYDPCAERQLGSLKKTEPKCEPEAEIAAKAWAQFASTAGPHDRHFRVGCAHATLRFSIPENGITVFIPGEAVPNAD